MAAPSPPRRGAAGAAVRTTCPTASGCSGFPPVSPELVVNDVVNGVVDDGVAEDAIATQEGEGKALSPYPAGMLDTADNLWLSAYLGIPPLH